MKQFHLYITGFVQGVGFRVYTVKKAKEMGVTGWVRNLRDGRVEAVIQGEEKKLNALIDEMKKGSYFSEVNDIVVKEEEVKEKFSDMRKEETA